MTKKVLASSQRKRQILKNPGENSTFSRNTQAEGKTQYLSAKLEDLVV